MVAKFYSTPMSQQRNKLIDGFNTINMTSSPPILSEFEGEWVSRDSKILNLWLTWDLGLGVCKKLKKFKGRDIENIVRFLQHSIKEKP